MSWFRTTNQDLPTLTVLPHPEICPQGKTLRVSPGTTLARAMLDGGVNIDHACELSCACTTCHVVVRQGFNALTPARDDEEDMLDKAWGLCAHSRLSCQARMPAVDVVVEIPRYTLNHARES